MNSIKSILTAIVVLFLFSTITLNANNSFEEDPIVITRLTEEDPIVITRLTEEDPIVITRLLEEDPIVITR